jgi:hypothetical protein
VGGIMNIKTIATIFTLLFLLSCASNVEVKIPDKPLTEDVNPGSTK